MTVDPDLNYYNPEVCDPCAGNCNNLWLNVFGATNNVYLQTVRSNALPLTFNFYIGAIAQPASEVDPGAGTRDRRS